MKIIINPKGTLAIYEQIVNQLRNAIMTGELSPGEGLPSIRTLASELEISVITTKRAYEELEKENLIRSVAGKGFYVCENNREYLREKNYRLLESRMEELLKDCKSAGMSKKEIVSMIEELFPR
ncbi:MAG: GntR family transcriptional regulator [Roseburia sp.]|nr:GntR family transcriptional regulator [Roseburia sp.]